MMMCQDCIALVSRKHKLKAEWVLFPDWEESVVLLCQEHLDEYAYSEGEMNLTFLSLDDLGAVFREVNSKMKFRSDKYSRLLKEWSECKKKLADLTNKGEPQE